MVNDLIDGISIKLNQVFGDGYEIYTDDVKQGLKEPCFFIKVLNPSQTPMLTNRYFREHPFDIHFFPLNIGNNSEIQDTASELFEALEFVTLINGDMIRGTEMNHETVDGVLHFFVKYNMFVRKSVVEDDMETITVETGVRGD